MQNELDSDGKVKRRDYILEAVKSEEKRLEGTFLRPGASWVQILEVTIFLIIAILILLVI